MPTSVLTTKGRIVIPKPIRSYLGLHAGDRLDFILCDNGEVVVRPVAEDVRKLKGMLRRPGRKPVTVAEMHRAFHAV